MTTARQTASYLLWKAGDSQLTNRELLKILYYAQGWFLGLYGKPLFRDRIEAWPQGPVQPAVYGEYKNNSWNPIPAPDEPPALAEPVRRHLDRIVEVFAGKGDALLVEMTHAEPPWLEARKGLGPEQTSNNEISVESMKAFFDGLLHGADVDPQYEWARRALRQRAEEEQARFGATLERVVSRNKEALEDLAHR